MEPPKLLDYPTAFLQISVWLTGFTIEELEGTGMAEVYYETVVQNNTASCLQNFFETVEEIFIAGEGDEAKTNAMIASRLFPTSCYNNLAQNIVNMWYLGVWEPVAATKSVSAALNISPEAYVQSLVWPAAKTHPPGAKQPGYGSWAFPPFGNEAKRIS